jgi:hypothetical protein
MGAEMQLKIFAPSPTTWQLSSIEKTIDEVSIDLGELPGGGLFASPSGAYTIRFFGDAIPEPQSLILFLLAILQFGLRRRRNLRAARDCE